MRLKNFLIEESGRTKSIILDEAIILVKEDCMKAYKSYYNHSSTIYRGIENSFKYGYVDPKKFTRESAYTHNYYTLIIDNSSKWKQYPKRSKSIVCSTDADYVDGYGQVYVVLPYDNSKIGVCSALDIWDSFREVDNLNGFNEYIKNLFEFASVQPLELTDKSIKNLKKACKIFDTKVNEDASIIKTPLSDYYIRWLYGYKGDLWKLFEELLDPKANRFKLVKAGDKIPDKREVWTDGKSILVHLYSIAKFIEAMKN